MKKFSNLIALVIVVFNITISLSFPFITISTEDLNTNTVTTVDDRSEMEKNVMTLQSHFPSRRVNTLQ